ncbi:hypothetical protein BOTBODRAFT_55200 [Botryobasidium botryosum FD-172 SS1]|uniref:Topoisomerase I damage affected protein 2 n=1 Tax=Botryobasidium botryosum (strain FD-172 SS1) TaxID=930990 RepID=A0A067MGL9_BOTB1|nr:hypothetical protein BOTBODRAFT_55200 [Botryobasidium botryosum FD-172 SS1]
MTSLSTRMQLRHATGPPRSNSPLPGPSPLASPPTTSTSLSRSNQASPRPKFDCDALKPYIKVLLSKTLTGYTWDPKERDRTKSMCKEIGERVKERMIEIQPKGFKYIVTTFLNENLGQGGRADLSCHWEDSDTVAQEVFVNDSFICICIAFAIRTV